MPKWLIATNLDDKGRIVDRVSEPLLEGEASVSQVAGWKAKGYTVDIKEPLQGTHVFEGKEILS